MLLVISCGYVNAMEELPQNQGKLKGSLPKSESIVPINLMWVNKDFNPYQKYLFQPKVNYYHSDYFTDEDMGEWGRRHIKEKRGEFVKKFCGRVNKNSDIDIWFAGTIPEKEKEVFYEDIRGYAKQEGAKIKQEDAEIIISNIKWRNSELEDSVEEGFVNQFLVHVFNWAEKNHGGIVNIWFDGAMLPKDAPQNTLAIIKKHANKNPEMASIELRDVRTIPMVTENSDAFSSDLPVFFRVDLLRPIIAMYMLENNETDRFVYADLDVEPMTQEQLFDDETMRYLKKFGIVMARGGYQGFENSFQIISNYNKNLLEAINFALIGLNLERGKIIYKKFKETPNAIFSTTNDRAGSEFRDISEDVYDDYRMMFAYFYSLQGYGSFKVSEPNMGRASEQNFDIHSPDQPQHFFKDTVDITMQSKSESIWRFVPDEKYKEKIYLKQEDEKGQKITNKLLVPTKKVKCPPSHFGTESSPFVNYQDIDKL